VGAVIPTPFGELLGVAVLAGGIYLMRLGRHLWTKEHA
jgi:hypothetical protein